MSVYSSTLDELIERTFRLCLGTFYEGTATGGSTTTVVDSSRWEADDFFQNLDAWARIRTTTDDAAPKGEERKITDWVQSSGTATVAPAFSVTPAAGDTYCFMYEYRWDEVMEAINASIDLVARHALVEKIDHSVMLKDNVYEYSIPSGFLYLYNVSMADSNGNYSLPIDPTQYKIIRGTTPPRIHFYADSGISADNLLRIEGFGRQSRLVKGTDICRINPDFLCYQAAAFLHARRIRRSDSDPDEQKTQFTTCQQMADSISGSAPYFRNLTPQFPPDMKRVEA